MRYVPSDLRILTAQGYDLVAAGDLDQARLVLEDGFTDVDFDDAGPDAAEAASLYARILLACGQPRPAGDWAAYAHGLAADLYGPADVRTVRDAATLAAALQRAGNLATAEQLYREVVRQLASRDGPDSKQTLAARADLATVLHARGDCATARAELADALAMHQRVYGPAEPAGIRMLARLAAMARDCGDPAEAVRLFTRARALCREHLPPDHPMAAQVAALAAAPATRDHACGVTAMGGPRPGDTTDDDLSWWPPEPDPPEPWPSPEHDASARWTSAEPDAPPPSRQNGSAPEYSRERDRPAPWGPPEPDGSDPWGPPEQDTRNPWGPPELDTPDPWGPAERDTPDPWGSAERDAPTGRWIPPEPEVPATWTPEADARWASRATTDVHRPGAASRDALLPVPRRFPPPPPPRRRWRRVVIGLVLAAIGVVGGWLIARVVLDRVAAPPASPTESQNTTRAGGPAPAAPSAVSLRDNRQSITLTWKYPPGAEGPVVVSGGRSGQDQRAFQTLPAGTTTYTLYGLAERTDYCFTVAVIYSTDTVARAQPVCTTRGAATPSRTR